MKVQCERCGKRFDYDIYSGMCPNCFSYYRMRDDDSDRVTPQETKDSIAPSQNKRGRKYYIGTACLIALMLLLIAVTISFTVYKNEQGYEAGTLSELPKAVPCTMNKMIPIPCATGTFELVITNSTVYQNDDCHVPEGYDIITVSYFVQNQPEDSYDVRKGLKPYLFTKSGSYLRPLSNYDFENLQILEPNAIAKCNISDYFEYDEDNLYFLVKKNDAAGLRINYHDISDYDSPEILKDVYEITDLEVK